MEAIITIIQQILTMIGGGILSFKALLEAKKLLEDKIMPDIKVEETAENIKSKQELAKHLVIFAGIEAAYNTARALIIALYFVLTMHYAFKFTLRVLKKESDTHGH